jgi:hypothetical protein
MTFAGKQNEAEKAEPNVIRTELQKRNGRLISVGVSARRRRNPELVLKSAAATMTTPESETTDPVGTQV